MPSPAEIPQRDEALKALVEKFEAAPGSRAFVELAAALLARGHASESLRVAEHGLQIRPDDVDGRVERAAALLALGRPRVAYVELLRALAIHPEHKRGMRLLGKTFRDAGAPHRAAALLAKRSKRAQSTVSSTVEAHLPEPKTLETRPALTEPAEATAPVPALFSALTKDLGLGLGAAVPSRKAPPRVEVTQIMRRRRAPRPPRSDSELVEIEGPIVDTTQPGKIESVTLDDEPAGVTEREPAPVLWNDRTPGLTDFALDDEPLFQENMPFAVRPVSAEAATEVVGADEPAGDTVVDEIEEATAPLERAPDLGDVAPLSLSELPGPPDFSRPSTSDLELPLPPSGPMRSPPPASLGLDLAPTAPPERAAPTAPMARRADPRAPTNLIPPADTAPVPPREERAFEPAGAVVERPGRRDPGLSVVTPKTPRAHLAFAAVAAVLMLAYVAGLVLSTSDTLSVWWSAP